MIIIQDTKLEKGELKNAAVAQVDTITTPNPDVTETESLPLLTQVETKTVETKQDVPQASHNAEIPISAPVDQKVINQEYLNRHKAVSINGKTYTDLENELLTCIAYVENFSDTAYFCGAKWTIGYGTTGYPNGNNVLPGQRITRKYALECVRYHLRRYVFPVIEGFVERELSQNEMIATCLFVYNIGGGNFTNRKGLGPCAFLKALNNNETAEQCVRKLTEYRYAAGNVVEGLLKRRWVEGAIFCGHLTPTEILLLSPAGFYNARNLTEYYTAHRPDQDGLYSCKYDQDTLNDFLGKNKGSRYRVKDII